jgi:soluble cytochrome b562
MEEITLEKIDIIRGRTGISYREAKEALERNQGILLDTLIELDEKKETKETNWTEGFSVRSGEVIDKVKALLHEGNVNRISIKSEGRTLVEIPVTLGALGAVVLPQIAALGVLVAMFKRCSIEVVRNDGSSTETEVSDDEPVDSDEQKNKFHKDSGI